MAISGQVAKNVIKTFALRPGTREIEEIGESFFHLSPERIFRFNATKNNDSRVVKENPSGLEIYRTFLDVTEGIARAQGIPKIELSVHKDNNKLIQYYAGFGFVVVGPLQKQPGILLMEKKL